MSQKILSNKNNQLFNRQTLLPRLKSLIPSGPSCMRFPESRRVAVAAQSQRGQVEGGQWGVPTAVPSADPSLVLHHSSVSPSSKPGGVSAANGS